MKTLQRTRLSGFFAVVAIAVVSVIVISPVSHAADGTVETISLHVRQSKIIDAPWPVARVSVTDPEIADVQMLTANQILVQGKAVGSTDLLLWSKEEKVFESRIDVSVDFRRMKDELSRLFPYSKLNVTQAQDVIVISGTLNRAEQAAQLRRFIDASEDAGGLKYVDMTSVAGVQQVMLKVRIAEVSRRALRMLGVNWFNTNNDYFVGQTLGSAQGGPINPFTIGVPAGTSANLSRTPMVFTNTAQNASSVTLFAGFPEIGLKVFLQALAENSYLRILAEPTLVALSGQEAKFLVGGQFPVPVIQGSSGVGGGDSITIEWKDYGVLLQFTPTVLGDGSIRLHLAPEVSETSEVDAVVLQGFIIPAVVQRKAETTLEMKSGQTFAMAGLLRRSTAAQNSRIPGLGDIPILGSLFRSVRYLEEETDLVILVTATLVEPMDFVGDLPVPGDTHVVPTDWELYVEGRISGETAGKLSPAHQNLLKRRGLDRLKGPGAWVTYETPPARSTAKIEAIPAEPMPAPKAETKAEVKQPVAKAAEPPAVEPVAIKEVKPDVAVSVPAAEAETAVKEETVKAETAVKEEAAKAADTIEKEVISKKEATVDPPEVGIEPVPEADVPAADGDTAGPNKLPEAGKIIAESV